MIKSLIINALKISKTVLCYFFIFFFFKINDSYAFVGGASMGVGGGASSAGTPSIKSGISIVDPEGKAYNCEPFVDKKWESTSSEDSWNGVYFSLGFDSSKFSGKYKIENSDPEYQYISANSSSSKTTIVPVFSEIGTGKNFSGASSMPVLTVGGGFLIDRMYLATDLEIRALPLDFTSKAKINEITYDSSGKEDGKKEVETTLTYSLRNYVMFNAKIGYLMTGRSMVYFNAGIGSFSSSSIKTDNKYSIMENEGGDNPPPIRLSLGTEFLLSNHFRLVADYSYWIVPQNMGNFYLSKSGSSQSAPKSENSYVADFKINSLKFGILYRF
jgi:opacity protein-like surface antigen